MARVKRPRRALWIRKGNGKWHRLGLGRVATSPIPREYNVEWLSHRQDSLEAIISEAVDSQGRKILLAKWQGFPAYQSTWELEWRFAQKDLDEWASQKRRLEEIERFIDSGQDQLILRDLEESEDDASTMQHSTPESQPSDMRVSNLTVGLTKHNTASEQSTNSAVPGGQHNMTSPFHEDHHMETDDAEGSMSLLRTAGRLDGRLIVVEKTWKPLINDDPVTPPCTTASSTEKEYSAADASGANIASG